MTTQTTRSTGHGQLRDGAQMPLFTQCQRWRAHRSFYRPAGEPFNPRYASVEPIEERAAKDYICLTHYSRSYPAARARYGLIIKRPFRREELAGVGVFSVPITNAVIPAYFPDLQPHEGIECGRFCLSDHVEANGETWALSRMLRLLNHEFPEVQAVLSFCDPVARTDIQGRTIFPGHLGTIYAAAAALRVGRSSPRTLRLLPNGLVASERALSKIRNDETGAAYALAQLAAAGAPARADFESGTDYLARLEREGVFRRLKHPGNWAFGYRLRRLPVRGSGRPDVVRAPV
jgi:hypothetical protein